MASKLFRLLLLFICLAVPRISWALATDRDKPVYIVADQVEYQQKTGVIIYTGHVKVNQGTSHLLADILTVYYIPNSNKIEKMIAKGNLAKYSTLPKEGGKMLNASAQTIQYAPANGMIFLLGNAVVTQNNNSFHGQHIEYNLTKQTVVSAPSPNSKTVIIIHPDGGELP